ncbi:hypothetical protein A5482_014845 (plasmid) [Cyanobacterium sp. IPPAS B-1200]|uniref:hypothetical protein n=1 Tax=Cyanobacterium sp. IPPAS B-1200 TaxID=1562720 RepID=UPI0008525681|nr:hypothetical protein [Cyanobacterium sp. IPPAS B-1200]OEJ78385.1 hypothetical protein A5482_13560 [Cyanobacterium sp. IPPAS B-1200]
MNKKTRLGQIVALLSSSALLAFSISPNEAISQTTSSFEISQRTGPNRGWVRCSVTGLQRGQLAVRNEPAGPAIVGLDNGNTVLGFMGSGTFIVKNNVVWNMVKVIQGPNSRVNNREGWVNSDYLDCDLQSL